MTLTLPYPPSANRYLRHTARGTYRTSEANAYRRLAQITALQAGIHARHTGPVEIHATLHPRLTKTGQASERRIDLDNSIKVIFDSLEGVAYENDKQIVRITLEVGHPIDSGGLTLTVEPCPVVA